VNRRLATAITAAMMMVSASAFAHHGAPPLYDVAHPITIKGVITEFVWENPHAQFFVDVKDASGKVVNWAIETNGPAQLRRAGWTRTTLKPGDVVEVRLVPAWTGAPVGFSGWALGSGKVTLANGQTITTQETPDNYSPSDPRSRRP
jgi:hypothetical protein